MREIEGEKIKEIEGETNFLMFLSSKLLVLKRSD